MDQSIQKNLGSLEEQLERLDSLLNCFDPSSKINKSEVSGLMIDELTAAKKNAEQIRASIEENLLWEKSFPLQSVMERLNNFVINEANKVGIQIAIGCSENGRVPYSLIHGLMPSISLVLRIVIDRLVHDETPIRKRSYKLKTKAVTIQMEGSADFFHIKIMDDAENNETQMIKYRKDFQKIRADVAKFQGFCTFNSREPYGFECYAKVPMPRSRMNALVVSIDGSNYVIPLISVRDILKESDVNKSLHIENDFLMLQYKGGNFPVCTVDSEFGVCPVESNFVARNDSHFIVVGVADFNLAIHSNITPRTQKVRVHAAGDFLSKNAWHQDLALLNSGSSAELVPLINGDVLVSFQRQLQVRL